MSDIKAFKSPAGEMFVCFNENSHSYKLFLNMLKSAVNSSDTAIKNMATVLSRSIDEAKVDTMNKGIVANTPQSDGGLSHQVLSNITNKLDLMFNTLSSLKTFKPEPVEHKLDLEALDVFAQKLETSLGTLIASKVAPINAMPLPEDFAEKAVAAITSAFTEKNIAGLATATPASLGKIETSVKQIQDSLSALNRTAPAIDMSTINAKISEIKELIADSRIYPVDAQTQQISSVSQITATQSSSTPAPVPIPANTTASEQAKPSSADGAIACEDMVMRYPAKSKKTQPKCFGQHLPGTVDTTPCLSCVYVNDCKNKTRATAKTQSKEQNNKPDCFGEHKGDLDCSVCSYDEECAAISG